MSNPSIEFTMLDNAVDSMERVVELLAWHRDMRDNSRLKQAIILTAHSIELLLKERLRRVHPSLIWEDVDKYPRLDARTVTVDKAIHRLQSIAGIALHEKDARIVRSLRDTRNAVEHFSWQTTTQEANHIIGQGLSFAISFAKTHLATDLMYRFRDDNTWAVLIETNEKFASAYDVRVKNAVQFPPEQLGECSFCRAMAKSTATGACTICGHWEYRHQEKVEAHDTFNDDIPF